jgi:hypothetical protein
MGQVSIAVLEFALKARTLSRCCSAITEKRMALWHVPMYLQDCEKVHWQLIHEIVIDGVGARNTIAGGSMPFCDTAVVFLRRNDDDGVEGKAALCRARVTAAESVCAM